MWKYQYDDEYWVAEQAHLFSRKMMDEEEECYAHWLRRRFK